MKIFNYDWHIRSGLEGGTINYTGIPVVKTSLMTLPNGTKNRNRIEMDATLGSIGIQIPDYLGFGTYTTEFYGRIDAFDPLMVTTCWLHDDDNASDPKRLELDWEHTNWGDINNPNRHNTGILRGDGISEGHNAQPAVTYLQYRVTLSVSPDIQRVLVEGYRPSDNNWVGIMFSEYKAQSPRAGRFKIALWWLNGTKYPTTMTVKPKILVTDFKFVAL